MTQRNDSSLQIRSNFAEVSENFVVVEEQVRGLEADVESKKQELDKAKADYIRKVPNSPCCVEVL